jgi:hypothetical protein
MMATEIAASGTCMADMFRFAMALAFSNAAANPAAKPAA